MKHEKISIKWKIFAYLLSFVAMLLVLLWFFQTVYLDVFYKNIKINQINDAMEELGTVIDDENLDEKIDSIAGTYDISIVIADTRGNQKYASQMAADTIIQKFSPSQIYDYYQQALEQGGNLTINVNDNLSVIPDRMGSRFEGRPGDGPPEGTKSVVLLKVLTTDGGGKLVALLNSVIKPVDATVHTLRIQLIYISIILIILSLVIALLISRRVSKSIIKVNASAKELAKGNFRVKFAGNDYKEIAELSDTLNSTAEELSKTEALQRELISNVSHDLRTPLTMITAYAEVMRDLPGENNPENVQVVIEEARRLTNLVNDLLDISKIQAGVSKLDLKCYDITESIKSVIGRYAKLIKQNGYNINFQYTRHIEVEADEFKIFQVIYNLINNAINYTGADKTVKVRQIVNGEIVRIEIRDSGEGIDKDEIKNVWERYYKIDKEHKQALMGTGLGLSIVKNILDLHHAKYGVDSVLGEGCTFWFELKIIFPK